MKTLPIHLGKKEINDFCQRHYIRRLSLFGSVLRDDFRPDSDIDVLVEFEPGKIPSFLKLSRIEREFSEILAGRRVDLRTIEELSPYFRDRVLNEALIQYDGDR